MQTIANAIQDYMGPVPSTPSFGDLLPLADSVSHSFPLAATNPAYKHREDGSTMRALAWFGNKDVRMVDAPIPDISEEKDVIIKVTGTTICGSGTLRSSTSNAPSALLTQIVLDLHLYHSEMIGLQKGDILGHEFM